MTDGKTDHDLMAAVAQGDLSRMAELYERRHRTLFRFFVRLTGRQSLSEDLTHEVFLRMLRYRQTYNNTTSRDEKGFDAWMYRIARNAFADHGRKNYRESTTEETFEFLESGSPNPFETTARKQETALLHKALKAMSPERRELLVLTRFQGLSHEQAGKILGCEANTVKVRVFRAMKEIGRIYENLQREKAS